MKFSRHVRLLAHYMITWMTSTQCSQRSVAVGCIARSRLGVVLVVGNNKKGNFYFQVCRPVFACLPRSIEFVVTIELSH
jgi:hypothetical protein